MTANICVTRKGGNTKFLLIFIGLFCRVNFVIYFNMPFHRGIKVLFLNQDYLYSLIHFLFISMIFQEAPAQVVAELPEIMLFNRWSCDDVHVADMSLQVIFIQ